MKIKTFLSWIISAIATIIAGCASTSPAKIRVAGSYFRDSTQERQIDETIKKLTSCNFFEYTEAARKLIGMGSEAIPILYEYRGLVRDVDGCNVCVCVSIIEIIFQQQSNEWVKSRLNDSLPEIAQIASKEWERRQKAVNS